MSRSLISKVSFFAIQSTKQLNFNGKGTIGFGNSSLGNFIWNRAIQSRAKQLPAALRRIRVRQKAQGILSERGVDSVVPLMGTIADRIKKQISIRTSHSVLPLHSNDSSAVQAQREAQKILLNAREKTLKSWMERHGIPTLKPAAGLASFSLPLCRLYFSYCSHYACSAGLRSFLATKLNQLAIEHPSVHFVVESRWGQTPMMRAYYAGAGGALSSNHISLRNMDPVAIGKLVERCRDAAGVPSKKFKLQVKSQNHAVRPLWSPFHNLPSRKNNPLSHIQGKRFDFSKQSSHGRPGPNYKGL